MKPEEGGAWFFLMMEPHGLIIDRELASTEEIRLLIGKLALDGIKPVLNTDGAWKALDFHEDFSPYSIPESINMLSSFLKPKSVITLDNGCLPSIEWRFTENGVEVFDTFDY
ncbi:hypothetical protein RF679_11785 [Undibacterium cyanobacteriorum]|uniref:Uncharacterized protein n=1 Tax=Undibacterium cyanobacteriorum TaxID=3073561 RepID=A0ABY9RDK9_9BURK|nr:hypothetical protein [Undibacterium sp. 20NA77.5]WMW79328.1 hypothetical protein RF679_11785 [Undibacterium sp. 20NA77.5]